MAQQIPPLRPLPDDLGWSMPDNVAEHFRLIMADRESVAFDAGERQGWNRGFYVGIISSMVCVGVSMLVELVVRNGWPW